jgi:hypothetical protein
MPKFRADYLVGGFPKNRSMDDARFRHAILGHRMSASVGLPKFLRFPPPAPFSKLAKPASWPGLFGQPIRMPGIFGYVEE